jgi:formylglycine-generating enzyme
MRASCLWLLGLSIAAGACGVDYRADQDAYERKRCEQGAGACAGTGGAAGSAQGGSGGGTAGASGAGADGGTGGGSGSGGGCGVTPVPISCVGLTDDCGHEFNDSCCATLCVPASTFNRGRLAGDPDDTACATLICKANEQPAAKATISAFWLDKYEVTVGRFRKFPLSGFTASHGDGQHGYLSGGFDGWQNGWPLPTSLTQWVEVFSSCLDGTWTDQPGSNENLPMTCLNWYDAYAFCIWDGGFLPTDAEWELAASGGEERVYPWSVPPDSVASGPNYGCGPGCNFPLPVGMLPSGAGRWGHLDLGGNAWEWTLDYDAPYTADDCNDCADLFSVGNRRSRRSGRFTNGYDKMRAVAREPVLANGRSNSRGVRCARKAE